jgi:hypothetical protein
LFQVTNWAQVEHLLQPIGLCVLDHPYILSPCPFDAFPLSDVIEYGYLNGRTAYALLRGILYVLHYLLRDGIVGVSMTSRNILIGGDLPYTDPSSETPRFWLSGVSSARRIPADTIKERHSADVVTAIRIITDNCAGPNYFQDPMANDILLGLPRDLPSKPLTAREILDEFESVTNGPERNIMPDA